jgi:ribosome-binding protein aMBF1 (putative translation factor)
MVHMTKAELKKAVSYQIFCRRTDKGISQPMLAYMLGVHERNVRRWESRDGLPSPVMLCRMAEIFSCTTDDLLGRSKERDGKRVFGAAAPDTGGGHGHGGADHAAV